MGRCFEIDVTDMMHYCQMGDVLREEEVQIISYYLDLAAGEGEDSEHREEGGKTVLNLLNTLN